MCSTCTVLTAGWSRGPSWRFNATARTTQAVRPFPGISTLEGMVIVKLQRLLHVAEIEDRYTGERQTLTGRSPEHAVAGPVSRRARTTARTGTSSSASVTASCRPTSPCIRWMRPAGLDPRRSDGQSTADRHAGYAEPVSDIPVGPPVVPEPLHLTDVLGGELARFAQRHPFALQLPQHCVL